MVHQRHHLVHGFAQPFLRAKVAKERDHFAVHEKGVAVGRVAPEAARLAAIRGKLDSATRWKTRSNGVGRGMREK